MLALDVDSSLVRRYRCLHCHFAGNSCSCLSSMSTGDPRDCHCRTSLALPASVREERWRFHHWKYLVCGSVWVSGWTGSMGVYLRSYPIPVPLIVVVGAWHIIFVRAAIYVCCCRGVRFWGCIYLCSTAAQPTFGELLGERRVGGGIYCAVRGCGCVCESVIEAPGSPMTGGLHNLCHFHGCHHPSWC